MSMLTALNDWVAKRIPLQELWDHHMARYYAPKNFNFWYYFGSIALLVLVIQLLSGIFLAINYKPDATLAFDSVEYIMRDVDGGWLVRYMHSTGASAFFIVVYLHMYRALMYGSHKYPRELLWILGMLIYVALMAEAFFGYLLPWGQMSYWGAQVIISLFSAIPVIGDPLAEWVRGDFVVGDATLNRFFVFHAVAVPIILLALVVVHIMALHQVGSNNPDGIEIKEAKGEDGIPLDGIPFHPYYSVKDIFGFGIFLFAFAYIMFYTPEMNGFFLEHPNFEPADPMKTPEHIAPVWYFTPFYAILRAVPDKLLGVVAMGGAIVVLFVLPWLDRSPIKSIRFRCKAYKWALALFTVAFLILGYLGMQAPTPGFTMLARVCTFVYFAFFLSLPLYARLEARTIVPRRVA